MKGLQSGAVHLGDTVRTSVHHTRGRTGRDMGVGTRWDVAGRETGLLLIRDIFYQGASTEPVREVIPG